MEKCTYCVQRIEEARAAAIREGRPLRDGDIVTACQQACPTEAIVFGDQNDPASRVAKLKAEERNYDLLASLNTRPRTTYLARIGKPQSGARRRKGARVTPETPAREQAPLVGGDHTFGTITDKISAIVLAGRQPAAWFVGFGIGFVLLNVLLLTITNLLFRGSGSGGRTSPSAGASTSSTSSGGSASGTPAR